ncbi:MAG: chemotaxis protein CheA [Nitrospirales bacterium]|nr:MAG: chemotaxis protein CheA [Nitrospirales bacterium]
MNNVNAAITEFLIESDEHVCQIEQDLSCLESAHDQRLLFRIIRATHSIKSSCAFLGYFRLESLTDTGERLLHVVRDRESSLTPKMTQALLAMVDAIRHMLECIEQEGMDGENEYVELKQQLEVLQCERGADVDLLSDVSIVTSLPCSPVDAETVQEYPPNTSVMCEPVRANPELDEAVVEFLKESHESLSQVERDLVASESHSSQEKLACIFRGIHTIKGTCSFLGYAKLEGLTHAGEALLSCIRNGDVPLTVERVSALLSLVDAVRTMLDSIAEYRHDGIHDYLELHSTLVALQTSESDMPMSPELSGEDVSSALPSPGLPPLSTGTVSSTTSNQGSADSRSQDLVECGVRQQAPYRVGDARQLGAAESSIRVDVTVLDTLMRMVGELVLTRNQIVQCPGMQQDSKFMATAQRLSLITAELQSGLMKTRMQPIGNMWNTFPRVVRDLALACGKDIRLEMEGQETELDKMLLEAIQGPLTHLVRNAVDHGIERPDVREANGKPRQGRIVLRAYHEGGQAHVEIRDDGRGITTQRVVEAAIACGVVTEAEVSRMQERDILQLVFLPGLSTAAEVTNLSGRGVGMDVVKTNIEHIGGSIEISCRAHEGTTVKVSVPLTLTISPALMVTVGEERFAISQTHLQECVRIDAELYAQVTEVVQDALLYRYRGHVIPLLHLNNVLQIHPVVSESTGGSLCSDITHIVVLQAGCFRFGLIVETVQDIEEIVIKPLGMPLQGLDVYAGVTIMGDGHVALVLDVMGLARRTNFVLGQDSFLPVMNPAQEEGTASSGTSQMCVIAQVGEDDCVAIPVHRVTRITDVQKQVLHVVDGNHVMRYHGQIVLIVWLSSLLGSYNESPSDEPDVLQVVLMDHDGQYVGVVVDRIIDIVDVQIDAHATSNRPGMLGSTVIQGKVSALLDVDCVLKTCLQQPVGSLTLECLET